MFSEKRTLIYLIVTPNLAPENKKPCKSEMYRVLSGIGESGTLSQYSDVQDCNEKESELIFFIEK